MNLFKVISEFEPKGDQPKAIKALVEGVKRGYQHQVLLGVTGSGKTFTMAKVIEALQRPALIISHNKTLAAQLYREFKNFFPHNAVEYFVSFYDYYQPEAYIPHTDTYIEKEAMINLEIEKLRYRATKALFERRDVIIVASVSCIYGLGSPEAYYGMVLFLQLGQIIRRREILNKLVEIQYTRNDIDFHHGTFRVRGDTIEVFPPYEDEAVRIELFGDEIDRLSIFDPLTGKTIREVDQIGIYPNTHYMTTPDRLKKAIKSIREELAEQLQKLRRENKLLEAERLQQRTLYDLELLELTGHCPGIENYSRHLTGRAPGEPPPTLMDYLHPDTIIFIDESHVTIPQLIGMYRGDRSRKLTLVKYGFRLPSALDNRPLKFEEFEKYMKTVIYVSATPGPYELEKAKGRVIEQIIRPTGLIDPEVEVRPAKTQVRDLLNEIKKQIEKGGRVLVTTLTKRFAEDLTQYYTEMGIKVRYLHSEIDTLDRVKLIKELRLGKFDVLIGINLLREGLDIPEVTLVAILDADKEGFLRSQTALIQTIGRCARNVNGKVILYADKITKAIENALKETNRRRELQKEYNIKHNITPQSIKKSIQDILESVYEKDYYTVEIDKDEEQFLKLTPDERENYLKSLEERMYEYANNLEFEKAAEIRDKIRTFKELIITT